MFCLFIQLFHNISPAIDMVSPGNYILMPRNYFVFYIVTVV